MKDLEQIGEAIKLLKEAAKILYPEQPYSDIEVLAAFARGIETIAEPVFKPYSFTNPHPNDRVEY